MRTLLLLMVAALASCGAQQTPAPRAAAPAPAPLYRVQVVNTYPHDRGTFTEGLFYRDGLIYESTGLEGKSFIRRQRLETGQILLQRDLSSQYFGEGIIDWEDRLFQLTWQNQKGGQRRGAISGYKAGLLCRRCRLPMSKESQIRKL